ncbi:MAG: hypothetical protein AB7L92_03695 [Alphaproteobacteria bacterium]
MGNIAKTLLASLIVTVMANHAWAATQGTLGATSQGSANISITKSLQAQITGIDDMTLANWSIGDGAVTLTSDVCIYSSTGSYTVRATGSGAANAFTISSGANAIIYGVVWNSGGAGNLANTGATLVTNIASATLNNADTGSATCSGGGAGNDTARIVVSITDIAMGAAPSSATPYTGTLTLLITPI